MIEMDILCCQTNSSRSIIEEEPQIQLSKKPKRDEYPIIWYDPDIDSEEKGTLKSFVQENSEIYLFSNFENVFKMAQSLGSFLLITSNEVDEEKLFQNFEGLEDTHDRRYFDFEEKAVLMSLFKRISEERIKSLKVSVFCTREDFLNEAPINEEEEEVVIMCDIKEMAKQFREEFTIIWCDPNYSCEKERIVVKQLDIEEKNMYTNFEELLKKLDDYTGLPYHLILSGKTQTELIINRIDDFKELLCLYIYESSLLTGSMKRTKKIEIEKTLRGLVPKIISGIRAKSVYKNTFPAFATQFDDWDKSHINKVHYYLQGFVNFKNRIQTKRDFVSLAKKIYQSQRLLDFEKEYFEYHKEQILKWYTEESPIYKLINNCLRISTSDSILFCRFILKDMEKAIKEEYQQESKKFNGVVYRGAYISKSEFEKLERNIGKEIEMYGFLSTSKNVKTAQKFLNDDIANKVLLTIIVPPLPFAKLDEQGFADISKFSKFSKEAELLFNVRSRFQIFEVGNIQLEKSQECRHIVLLYGAHLLRKYMTSVNPTISLMFELPFELRCKDCESKKNLFASTEETGKTQIICRGCLISKNFASKNTFAFPIDAKSEFAEERSINVKVKGTILDLGVEAKLAYTKAEKCHQCSKFDKYFYTWINLEEGNITHECLECFQKTQESKVNHLLLIEGGAQRFWNRKLGKSEEIDLDWKAGQFKKLEADDVVSAFEKAHDNVKCQEFCRTALKNSVRKMGRERVKVNSYCKLGKSSQELGEHQNALKCFQKVTKILEFIIPKESGSGTAISYNLLASVHSNLGEFQKALEYYLKALEIQKSIYGETHPDIAPSYNNLALLYDSLGEHQKALEYHLKALEIEKFIYGESHLNIATSFNNIALVYHNLGEYQKALAYHLKALEIGKSINGESHPGTAASYHNLALVYDSLGEFQKALGSHLKALEIQKSIYGESHPNTATSYNNIALVFCSLREFQKALEYHLKALKMQKSFYGESHPNIACSYHNLASVYKRLGKFQKALGYYLKALEIQKSIYGESHPDTATSYSHLGSVYDSLGEHQKALEYSLKALEMRKSIFGESHPDTAASYNDLALVYDSLRQYQKALEYLLKALEVQKPFHGESHPDTATSYYNIALVFYRSREYQKASAYLLKALEIQKSIYGESHPSLATSCNDLGSVYDSLGEHQKALEYSLKALEMRKSIFGESHPDTATSYNNIASVYDSLGEYQKALEYDLKALEIRKSINEESHTDTATLYKNLASVYDNLGKHQKALKYYLKALEMRKSIYGKSHSDTATSYYHLASTDERIREYQNALVYDLTLE